MNTSYSINYDRTDEVTKISCTIRFERTVVAEAHLAQDVLANQGGKTIYRLESLLVYADYRGMGVGSTLLTLVCKEADKEGATLVVIADPYSGSPLSRINLIRFYKRYGFKQVKGSTLHRTPIDTVQLTESMTNKLVDYVERSVQRAYYSGYIAGARAQSDNSI